MAKITLKSDIITPFGGFFFIIYLFDKLLSKVIDTVLPVRGIHHGYSYREILRSLMSIFFCGGSCVEGLSTNLMDSLKCHPTLRTVSSDTILRAITELSTCNITYASESGKSYDFNPAGLLNRLLVKACLEMGTLVPVQEYVLDFDHQVIANEKYDALPTYKHCKGYFPGVATIGDMIVGIENRDGNANIRFMQELPLERLVAILNGEEIIVSKMRMDCGSCSEEIIKKARTLCRNYYIRASNCQSQNLRFDIIRGWKKHIINGIEFELWDGQYICRCIMTNDRQHTELEISVVALLPLYHHAAGLSALLLGHGAEFELYAVDIACLLATDDIEAQAGG